MIWVDHVTGRYRLTLGTSFGSYLDSGRARGRPMAARRRHI